MKAQHGYYGLASARDALEARVEALRRAIPMGSRLLDLGCNDGTISRALLESGNAHEITGVDLEDIVQPRHPRLHVIEANLRTLDLTTLPRVDGVLLLNVLHHVVGSSRERAKEIIDFFLSNSKFIIIDMGSFTERGNWGWRSKFSSYWSSDGEMWDDLFASAAWRFKLLRYQTQGNGFRVLWKLYRNPYELTFCNTAGRFRRNVAAWPSKKELVPVHDVHDAPRPFGHQPYDLYPGVLFEVRESELGDRFWVKRHIGPRSALVTELEATLYERVRDSGFRIGLPVAREGEDGLIYLFEPDLFENKAVHWQDWHKFFSEDDLDIIHGLASLRIALPDLPRRPLIEVADFQAIPSWEGVKFIDFSPNEWVLEKDPQLIPSRPFRKLFLMAQNEKHLKRSSSDSSSATVTALQDIAKALGRVEAVLRQQNDTLVRIERLNDTLIRIERLNDTLVRIERLAEERWQVSFWRAVLRRLRRMANRGRSSQLP